MQRMSLGQAIGVFSFVLVATMALQNCAVFAQTVGNIYTVAGNGTAGYTGDGGAATSAEIVADALAYDPSGNLYISDQAHHVIRKVDTLGVISTFVGTGTSGYTGDGGAASSAEINWPTYMMFDPSGNFYFVDLLNYVIRKVDTSGTISTIAGTGVQATTLGQGDGGPATSARLLSPRGLVRDLAGNIYVADEYYVRKIDTSGAISSYAPQSDFPGTFPYLGGMWMDSSNNLYVCDYQYGQIVKVASGGSASVIAGTGIPGYSGDGGAATSATLNSPSDVVVDSTGNVFFADFGNHVIRKVDTGGTITTYAGNGYGYGTNTGGYNGDNIAATSAELWSPQAIRLDGAGNVAFADTGNNRIRYVYEHSPASQPPTRYRPSAYNDVGGDPTSNPTGLYNGSGLATVQSYTNYVAQGGSYYADVEVGDTTWSGFPSHVDSNSLTLHVPYTMSTSGYYSYFGSAVYVTISGVTTNICAPTTAGTGDCTMTISAGTNLANISVDVQVATFDDGNANPMDDSAAFASIDIYVQ